MFQQLPNCWGISVVVVAYLPEHGAARRKQLGTDNVCCLFNLGNQGCDIRPIATIHVMDECPDWCVRECGAEEFVGGRWTMPIENIDDPVTKVPQCAQAGRFIIGEIMAEFVRNDDPHFFRGERAVNENCSLAFERNQAAVHATVSPRRRKEDPAPLEAVLDEG